MYKKYEIIKQYYIIRKSIPHELIVLCGGDGSNYHCFKIDNGVAMGFASAMMGEELNKKDTAPVHKELFSIGYVFLGHNEDEAVANLSD